MSRHSFLLTELTQKINVARQRASGKGATGTQVSRWSDATITPQTPFDFLDVGTYMLTQCRQLVNKDYRAAKKAFNACLVISLIRPTSIQVVYKTGSATDSAAPGLIGDALR